MFSYGRKIEMSVGYRPKTNPNKVFGVNWTVGFEFDSTLEAEPNWRPIEKILKDRYDHHFLQQGSMGDWVSDAGPFVKENMVGWEDWQGYQLTDFWVADRVENRSVHWRDSGLLRTCIRWHGLNLWVEGEFYDAVSGYLDPIKLSHIGGSDTPQEPRLETQLWADLLFQTIRQAIPRLIALEIDVNRHLKIRCDA